MSETKNPYAEMVESLKEIILKWLDRVASDRPKEKRERFAEGFATLLILSAEWGAGDALAGWLLRHARVDKKKLYEVLKSLGVKNLPEPRGVLYMWLWDVMEKADFGDEELNEALRELNGLSRSGGRYIPKFMKKK